VLDPGELCVLAEACRTKDELDRLEAAVRALPSLLATGSQGQEKAHPLLAEVRATGCCWRGWWVLWRCLMRMVSVCVRLRRMLRRLLWRVGVG
jgi:hypothetical protein